MRTTLTLLTLISVLPLCGQTPELQYSQSDFDSFECCWRKLDAEKKYAESAALLEEYIKHSPNATSKGSLNWHTGQMFAAAGNNKKAIRYMKKTFNVFYRWFGGEEGRQWYFFAKGTVAFIKNKRRQLERMIHLSHKNNLPGDNNVKELEKLLTNWGQPYDKAY